MSVIKRDVIRVTILDEKYPDDPDVYEAVVEDTLWDTRSPYQFRIDRSTLTVTPESIPHYIALFQEMLDYANKEDK